MSWAQRTPEKFRIQPTSLVIFAAVVTYTTYRVKFYGKTTTTV